MARARARVAEAIADGGLDRPAHETTTGNHANLRRLLLDLVEEYGRHTGHADLLREAVDGRVGEDPPARVAAGVGRVDLVDPMRHEDYVRQHPPGDQTFRGFDFTAAAFDDTYLERPVQERRPQGCEDQRVAAARHRDHR